MSEREKEEEGIGGFPGRAEFSHMRSSSAISLLTSLPSTHCHARAAVTTGSTTLFRNSWSWHRCVSPGLTPIVTRKWSPLDSNELMKQLQHNDAEQDSTTWLGFSLLVFTVVNIVRINNTASK